MNGPSATAVSEGGRAAQATWLRYLLGGSSLSDRSLGGKDCCVNGSARLINAAASPGSVATGTVARGRQDANDI